LSAGRILVVDDDPQIRKVIRSTLTRHGYDVFDARTGDEALVKLREELPDLILLDLNLPGMGGIEACRAIRAGSEVPIIVLSVKSSEGDKVQALDAGADDYVTKPYGADELLARIRAALRRVPSSPEADPKLLCFDGLEIDFETRQVTVRNNDVHLTPKEFDLLRYLVAHAGQPVPHRRLLQAVWGPDYGNEVEYLRVFINQLRRKLEVDISNPRFILTEPWIGYRFVLPEKPEGK
jgi:two-component system, OmpR family, KDP operon response regulator KdpE